MQTLRDAKEHVEAPRSTFKGEQASEEVFELYGAIELHH
jgi:hypothetical protein